MSEYISRETVIAEIEKHLRIMGLTKHGIVYKTYSLAHEHIVELLRIIPAVDAVEVKYGIWIKEDYTFYRCSVCDQRISLVGNPTKYCPNCGARMDGRREDGDE